MVVVTPGWGDAVQAAKAGLVEIGDVFVVNKADLPGADEAVRELAGALDVGKRRAWNPPVIETVATDDRGIAELHAAITDHRRHLDESGERERRRVARTTTEVEAALRSRLRRGARSGSAVPESLLEAVVARRLDPWAAAEEVRL